MLIAENIIKKYPNSDVAALDNVGLCVNKGDFACIMGRSGSGKSTLLNILSSLMKPDSGRVLFNDTDITKLGGKGLNRLRSGNFSMIFQQHHLLPFLTAMENVLVPFMKSVGPVSSGQKQKAMACLDRVGLNGKHDRLPGELSGGEQQRVAIARALVTSPDIVFADEPTGSLDKSTGERIISLLKQLNKEGVTILMVTHDPDYAMRAENRIELADGVVV